MPRITAILLFGCAISLSIGHLDGADLLTKEQFESAFDGPKAKELFHTFLHSSYLFTRDVDNQLTPMRECVVLLRKQGKGTVNQQCGDILQKHYKPMGNMLLAYRCFKSDNSNDYYLHTAQIDDFRGVEGKWDIYFTPEKAEYCKPKWSLEESSQSIPLSKEQYEKAFENQELFHSHPYYTYVFTRDLTKSMQLVPIPQCYSWLWEEGKGIVHPNCFKTLSGVNSHVDDLVLESLLLPYRCYLNDNPKEYKLYNATINALTKEDIGKDTTKYFIYFTVTGQFDHCKPIWGREFRKTTRDEL